MTATNFLVPVDFSEYSDHAVQYAAELARALGARLTLLHVIHELPVGVGDWAAGLPESYLGDLEADVQQSLESAREQVKAAGVDADIVMVHGIPFQSIIDVARDRQADLIVMGTHGRTGLKHVLLGSVAERVVRHAPCPVLVVRP